MHDSIGDMIVDCLQNSVEANASQIVLTVDETPDFLDVCIEDNGKGMSDEELKRATDPFYTDGVKHKHRKVGLGLPFLLQTVDMTDGTWSIQSKKGEGTRLAFHLNVNHIDLPKIGDLPLAFFSTMIFNGNYELVIHRRYTGKKAAEYTVIRSELKEALGSFEDAQALALLKQFLTDQESEIKEIKNGEINIRRFAQNARSRKKTN